MSAPRVSGRWRYGVAKVLSTVEQRAGLVGEVGQRRDVGDAEQRVGGRLDPDHLRLVGDRGPHRVEVGQRDRGVGQPPALEHLVEQAVGAAVRVVREHHVVTRVEQAADDGVLGGQAGGEREPALPLLQRREGVLQGGAGGVGGAAVLVAAAQPADAVLLVGRGREDGRDHRPGHRVRLPARVDRTRLEARLLAVLLGHPARVSTAERWPGNRPPRGHGCQPPPPCGLRPK